MTNMLKQRSLHARCTALLLSLFFLLAGLTLPVSAGDSTETRAISAASVPVYVNGQNTGQRAYLLSPGVTYMPLRTLASLLLGEVSITWDTSAKTAYVKTGSYTISVPWNSSYISSNGRYFGMSGISPAKNVLKNGVTYVPLRTAVRAMGGEVSWNTSAGRVDIVKGNGTVTSGDSYYNKDSLYWLSRIIYAEAGDQTLEGQVAVGNVVMNRVRSSEFPNDIYGVIFDKKYGVQFTPVSNGTIYNTPSAESVIAAKLVLDGCVVTEKAMYFLDPRISSNFWVVNNRTFLFSLGCHDFYQ